MRFAAVLLLLAIAAAPTMAQWNPSEMVISPGIKIGWSSGDEGGMTMGFELSVIQLMNDRGNYVGLVFDFDGTARGRRKFHLGAEFGIPFLGMEIGPTIVVEEDESRVALTVTPYAGIYLLPYYSITFPGTIINEAGAYVKLPMWVDNSYSHFN